MPFAVSFRDLDAAAGLPKGNAFRAFKALDPPLREQIDFIGLVAARDADRIAALRDAGRIYRSSRNVVLMTAAAGDRILAALR